MKQRISPNQNEGFEEGRRFEQLKCEIKGLIDSMATGQVVRQKYCRCYKQLEGAFEEYSALAEKYRAEESQGVISRQEYEKYHNLLAETRDIWKDLLAKEKKSKN